MRHNTSNSTFVESAEALAYWKAKADYDADVFARKVLDLLVLRYNKKNYPNAEQGPAGEGEV